MTVLGITTLATVLLAAFVVIAVSLAYILWELTRIDPEENAYYSRVDDEIHADHDYVRAVRRLPEAHQ